MRQTKALACLIVVLIASAMLVQVVGALSAPTLQVNGKPTSVNVSPASVVWAKVFGGAEDDRLFFALPAGDGYLVAGSTRSIVPNTMVGWAICIGSDGNAVWNQTYLLGSGVELRYAINLTNGFLLIGNEYLADGGIRGLVMKIDDLGTVLWQTILGSNQTDTLYSGFAVPGGFVVVGYTSSNGGAQPQAWAVKVDNDGNQVWSKTYNFAQDTVAKAGVLAPDGGYVVAGYTDPRSEGIYDFLLLKLDTDGNLVWNCTYGSSGSQEAKSITLAQDGYVIVGDTQSEGTNIHAWVVKVNFNGAIQWAEVVGGKDADSPAYVTGSPDGGYLVTGFTFSWGAGNRDFWLFKLNSVGQVQWSCTMGDKGYQEAYAVIPTGNQYVLAGWTDPPGQPALIGKATYDFYIAKIDQPPESGSSLWQLAFYGTVTTAAILTVFLGFKIRKNSQSSR
jgi:hypothetical protein